MKIGILCAGDREVAPFLPMLSNCKVTEKAMLKFYEGSIDDMNVVTLFSGVCKVNAAIAAQLLIDTLGCTAVINAGTAGGIDPSLELFDTVISEEVANHDVAEGILTEFHPWLDSIYFRADETLLTCARRVAEQMAPGRKVVFGRMVTGERFIEDGQREQILKRYRPLSADMESASVAHVCYVNRVPFISVRTITDNASHSGTGEFEKNCEIASQISADIVRLMLKELQRR